MTPERQHPLAWPAGWKRTQHPQQSRFDTSPERATRGLLAEIERLGGRLPVISSNAQYRQDGMPYARQGYISDTGVAAYFQRKGKPVVFACDTYATLHDNIHAISKTIEAMRAIDRHGDIDGFALQEMAEACGLLKLETMTVPCGEMCGCYEYIPAGHKTDCCRVQPVMQRARAALSNHTPTKEQSNG